jgi:TolB-like protein/Flp pilus assembly protein TadD
METAARAQLDRLLASRAFAGSRRLRRFLSFAVEQALAGQSNELKEYTLGVEVFDRDSSYDPRIDPIVRVEARRLRAKLKSYYEQEGAGDPLVVTIPEGSYVPRFSARAAVPPPAPEVPTIAVLPFANFSPEPRQDYFCDGITEEIINALAKVEGIRVVARTSAFQFKGKSEDIREIAARLSARYVVEGSVRKARSSVRITAQLIDAGDGYHLWSESYERTLTDVFALQDEIAWAIVRALKVRLAPAARLVAAYDTDPDAYALYLKGRYYWNRHTISGLRKAAALFRQVLAGHPRYAPAWCGLADAYCFLAYHGGASPVRVAAQVEAAVAKAFEIDDSLAEAHAILGAAQAFYEWRWTEALGELDRAIQLAPGLARALDWRGAVRAAMGEMDAGRADIEAALRIDPLSLDIGVSLSHVLYLERRFDDAIEQCRRVLDLEPAFEAAYLQRGQAQTAAGEFDEAIRSCERAWRLGRNPLALGMMGEAQARAGRRDEALALLRRLDRLEHDTYVPPLARAFIHIGLGQPGGAFEWLERASWLAWLKVDPRYDGLRDDPRFLELLRRSRLV